MQPVFNRVCCARCEKKHNNIRANTIGGAITKATLECDGIVQTKEGPKLTVCATGVQMGD